MIGLHELKYSLGALFLIAMVVFLGFLPWVKAWGDGRPSSEASLLEATAVRASFGHVLCSG